MKAVVYEGPGQLTLVETDNPVLQANEALIRVEAVGICGSELEGYLGHSSIRVPPLIMGHEFCGTIAGMNGDRADLQIGDKVTVNPLIACNVCERCREGKRNICRDRKIIGIHRPGAFAEFVAVPLDNICKVPQQMDSALVSLAEPLAVCIHGIKLGMQPLENLLIFGAGPIGLLTLQAAKAMGCGNVLLVDKQETRLQYAAQLGAHIAQPTELAAECDALFGSKGVNTIIDCVGVEATREQALLTVNPGGTIVMVGLGHNESNLSMNHLVRQEISIIGSYTYTNADFEQSLALLCDHKIRMTPWCDVRALDEAATAFGQLVAHQSPFGKIILQPAG